MPSNARNTAEIHGFCARVLEVRIHLPPAESQANFGTWVIGGQGAATHRRHPWSGERVVNASASDNPSGRNLWAASKRRPRITSSSMSQRTRSEDWMQLQTFSS